MKKIAKAAVFSCISEKIVLSLHHKIRCFLFFDDPFPSLVWSYSFYYVIFFQFLYMFRDGTSVDFQSFTHLIGGDKWVGCDKGKDRVFGFLSTFSAHLFCFLSTFSVHLLMRRVGYLGGSKSWLFFPIIGRPDMQIPVFENPSIL